MRTDKSEELFRKAQGLMPGGVSSPVRAFNAVGGQPIYVKTGSGATIEDEDGNTYIDYVMSFGPLIFGHAPKYLNESLKRAIENGTSYGAPVKDEVILADLITKLHPAADWVRFVNSGTEAVMSAVRLARAVTGRSKIIKFAGCYHGHADSMLVKGGSGLATLSIASSSGVPEGVTGDTIVVELGKEDQLHEVFKEFGADIACVIIEGIPANMGLFPQGDEFMRLLETLCRKHDALLVLDEVITGFRVAPGGAAEIYGVQPDIVTFGKIIGGGLPVGAYAGKMFLKEHVAPLGSVYQAGTLSGNPLAMRAGVEVLSRVKESTYKLLEEKGEFLENSIAHAASIHAITIHIKRAGSLLWTVFQEDEPSGPYDVSPDAEKTFSLFHNLAMDEGLYMPPSAYEVWFVSTAHSREILEKTVEKINSVFRRLREMIQ